VARELGRDWHTVNDAVLTDGEALLDADTDRVGQVTARGCTRPSSLGSGFGDGSCGPPPSSTYRLVCSLMWCLVGVALNRPPGWPHKATSGARMWSGRRWTSPAHIGQC
jgi:hypothetical protein